MWISQKHTLHIIQFFYVITTIARARATILNNFKIYAAASVLPLKYSQMKMANYSYNEKRRKIKMTFYRGQLFLSPDKLDETVRQIIPSTRACVEYYFYFSVKTFEFLQIYKATNRIYVIWFYVFVKIIGANVAFINIFTHLRVTQSGTRLACIVFLSLLSNHYPFLKRMYLHREYISDIMSNVLYDIHDNLLTFSHILLEIYLFYPVFKDLWKNMMYRFSGRCS